MIETQRLSLRIGAVNIVDEVSLSVNEGEFLVVIGPNGAGKTTLLNLISGVARATSGRVLFGGVDITREPAYERARRGLGRTFQTSSIFPNLTVRANVEVATRDRARAFEALEAVGLADRAGFAASSLSHGQKRKLDLAILIAAGARVLLLDEPTAGLAMEDVPEIVALLRQVHRERGATVVMVEHRLDLVQGLADRMAVMHHGTLLAVDTPERIIANQTVQSAYLGDPL
jgi:branched-chain amino acid transport system ATP-binding protein